MYSRSFIGARTASSKEVARKSRQGQTRLTKWGDARNPFPMESFLPTKYHGSGKAIVALLNLLLSGANGQLLSDSVKSARSDLNKQDSCLMTGENLQQVVVSPSLTVVNDPPLDENSLVTDVRRSHKKRPLKVEFGFCTLQACSYPQPIRSSCTLFRVKKYSTSCNSNESLLSVYAAKSVVLVKKTK